MEEHHNRKDMAEEEPATASRADMGITHMATSLSLHSHDTDQAATAVWDDPTARRRQPQTPAAQLSSATHHSDNNK